MNKNIIGVGVGLVVSLVVAGGGYLYMIGTFDEFLGGQKPAVTDDNEAALAAARAKAKQVKKGAKVVYDFEKYALKSVREIDAMFEEEGPNKFKSVGRYLNGLTCSYVPRNFQDIKKEVSPKTNFTKQ